MSSYRAFARGLYRQLRAADVIEAANAQLNKIINVQNCLCRKFLTCQVSHEFTIEMDAEGKLKRGSSSECGENALIKRILNIFNWVHSQLACGRVGAAFLERLNHCCRQRCSRR